MSHQAGGVLMSAASDAIFDALFCNFNLAFSLRVEKSKQSAQQSIFFR
jgi:hypothetical protein